MTYAERFEIADTLCVPVSMITVNYGGYYIPKYVDQVYANKLTEREYKLYSRRPELKPLGENKIATAVNLYIGLEDLEGLKEYISTLKGQFSEHTVGEQGIVLHTILTLIPNFYEVIRKLKAT